MKIRPPEATLNISASSLAINNNFEEATGEATSLVYLGGPA